MIGQSLSDQRFLFIKLAPEGDCRCVHRACAKDHFGLVYGQIPRLIVGISDIEVGDIPFGRAEADNSVLCPDLERAILDQLLIEQIINCTIGFLWE